MARRAPCKHLFCPYTHPQPPCGVKRSKKNIFESSHVAYQIIREWYIDYHARTDFVLSRTIAPGLGQKVKTLFFSGISHVAYQIKGNGA